MDLAQKKILVTGAGGFVGACLVRRLLGMGVTPHVILRAKTDPWRLTDIKSKLTVHEGDLTDGANIKRIVEGIRPDIIYHLAAHGAYPTQNDAAQIININLLGTLNLLQALESIDYTLFVNTGSSSEYGFKDAPMKETDLPVPNSYYAVAKAASTMLCDYMATVQKKAIVTFRLFSVYGPYEEPTRLVPTIIRRALSGEDLQMVSATTARDFIFVDDVIDAYLNVDALLCAQGGIFNIGRGEQVNLKQMTDEVLSLTGSKVAVKWNAIPERIWDSSVWVGDVSKAAKILDFRPKVTLKVGLSKTIDWIKSHG